MLWGWEGNGRKEAALPLGGILPRHWPPVASLVSQLLAKPAEQGGGAFWGPYFLVQQFCVSNTKRGSLGSALLV
jgi:hypothetical protein